MSIFRSTRWTSRQTIYLLPPFLLLATAAHYFYGVSAEASVNRFNSCPNDAPIRVIVHNRTIHTVSGVEVSLSAHRGNEDKDILISPEKLILRNIAPFQSASACLADDAFKPVDEDRDIKRRIVAELAPPKVIIENDLPIDREIKKKKEHALLVKELAKKIQRERLLTAALNNPNASPEETAEAQINYGIYLKDQMKEMDALYKTPKPDVATTPVSETEDVKFDFSEVLRGGELRDNVELKVLNVDPSY